MDEPKKNAGGIPADAQGLLGEMKSARERREREAKERAEAPVAAAEAVDGGSGSKKDKKKQKNAPAPEAVPEEKKGPDPLSEAADPARAARESKKDRRLFYAAFAAFACVCADILILCILALTGNYSRSAILVLGALFYAFFAVGVILLIILGSRRRKWIKANGAGRGRRLPGALTFFSSPGAAVIDCLAILSLLALAAVLIFGDAYAWYNALLLPLTVFFVISHCLFNGKIRQFCFNKSALRITRAKESAK
ncbi:MAG: hypothetical protein K6C36_06640 [Clostridia bacterium]|nr:hypothetical protein [Clostridia bacterium]